MKNFIAVFMLFINFFSCQAQDTIIISKTFWGTLKNPSGYETIQEAIPINTEQMVLRFDLLTYLSKINGLEKLPNLIYLLIGHNMHDLSLLSGLIMKPPQKGKVQPRFSLEAEMA